MSNSWRRVRIAGTLCLLAANGGAKPVLVESGAVEGMAQGGLTVYLGLPFAAPPVGELRWREPQPAAPWEGTRKADLVRTGMRAERRLHAWGKATRHERRLPLSEYLDASQAGVDHLPVIVWIHGGGFKNGATSMPLYWGDKLAQRGVIFISIAYRLGPLGFLAHARSHGRVCATSRPATMDCSIRSRRSNGYGATSRRSAATRRT